MKNEKKLEEVFCLIEKGNDSEVKKDYWEAAKFFSDAMVSLFQLVIDMKTSNEEEQKIEDLCRAQYRQYLHRARKALIDALLNENTIDESDKNIEPRFIGMTDEEASNRVQLFGTLFSKELDAKSHDSKTVEQVQDQQVSLEERLKSLNESLPSRFKSDTERMHEINQSLKGLGVNTYSHSDSKPEIHIPLSTEEQINNIISQAQDETRFNNSNKSTAILIDDDDIVLTDEENSLLDESEVDDSSLLCEGKAKLENIRAIRKSVINAQVKLAEFLAILDDDSGDDDKKSGRRNEENENETLGIQEEEEKSKDHEEENAFTDHDSITESYELELELEKARTLLLKARKNLNNAVAVWEVEN